MLSAYSTSFIDRTNLGNAKIAGMEEDLKLHGHRYNVALTVFFITYSLFEVPCNIVLKMMRPSRWIAIMMLSVLWSCIPCESYSFLTMVFSGAQ